MASKRPHSELEVTPLHEPTYKKLKGLQIVWRQAQAYQTRKMKARKVRCVVTLPSKQVTEKRARLIRDI
jgi:hypothetical protein